MLESLVRCLRIRGRIASPEIPQDAFWSHGAEYINLPAWWILHLQAPLLGENGRGQPYCINPRRLRLLRLRRVLHCLISPWRTLDLIRRIEVSTSKHQKAIEANRERSRCYASLARVVLSRSPVRAYSSLESTAAPEKEVREDGTFCQKIDTSISRFIEVLESSDAQKKSEELWQAYTSVLGGPTMLTLTQSRRLLRLLHSSDSQVDAERLIAVFESIDTNARRPIHYSYAISAALKLNDIDTALYFHREAVSRLRTAAGASGILRFVIARENWDVAIALWQSIRDSVSLYPTSEDVWADCKTLPFSFLASRASAAADFAVQDLASGTTSNISAAKAFAMCLLRLCISMRGARVNVTHWKLVYIALTKLCSGDDKQILNDIGSDCLEQLILVDRPKHDEAALSAYLEICDQDHGFVPRSSLWRSLFERSVRAVTVPAILRLVYQWRERHGTFKVIDYLYALEALAEAGEIDAHSQILQLYQKDHPGDANIGVSQTMLTIHQQRCDPDGIVKAFEHLSSAQGFEVNVEHYNTVIRTFVRAGDAEAAYDWFRKLGATGLCMNQATYTTIMAVYAQRGDCAVVSDLYDEALSHQIEPDEEMFNMLIHTHVEDGQFDETQQLLEDAPEKFSKEFLTTVWNRLLFGHARQLNLVALKSLHMRMQELGVPSDEMTYAALVTGLSKSKFPQNAQKMVRKIMPSLGMQAGPIHHAAVMEGYIRTKEYRRVFINYQYMLSIGQTPDMNIKNLVLRAGASIDRSDVTDLVDEVETLPLARRIFDEIINDLDPSELASMDSFKYVGFERLDEAWISGYFEKMMMQYASANALVHVSELFDLYVRTTQKFSARDVTSSPPLKILSALLVCHGKAGNHEGVENCWKVAVTKCDQLSRSSKMERGDGDPKQMLSSRQLIVNHPLQYYLKYLAQNGNFQRMEQAVNELLRGGYDLTHANMNLYIQSLCQSPDLTQKLLALRLSEQHLMDEWWGWGSMKFPYFSRHFRAMENRIWGTKLRAPRYRTLVYLAKAYIDLGFARSNRRKPEALAAVQSSGEISRTLSSIENMPRLHDREQTNILGYRDA